MAERESSSSVEQLVALFQNGDDRAFALLIDRMMPMIRHETSRIRCNSADTEDLAQEALLGLLTAADKFRAELGVTFAAFARVCVRRRLLNAVQKLTTPELPQENEHLFQELERLADPKQSDPSEQFLSREADTALLERLKAQLSAMEYAVLTLHLSAYSYEEIASVRGISVKSVDNALQRVRKKLAHWL